MILNVLFYNIYTIPVIVIFFISFGLAFNFKNRLDYIKKLFKPSWYLQNDTSEKKGTSNITAMLYCVGTVLGIGNIIGGCMSVKIAGPGVVFWMVVSALFCGIFKYYENYVCLNFKKNEKIPDKKNICYFLMQKTLKFGKIFAIIYIIAFSLGYFVNGVLQVNQFFFVLDIKNQSINALASTIMAVVIFYLLSSKSNILNKTARGVVPFMFIGYITICLLMIFSSKLGMYKTLKIVMENALDFKAGLVGFMIGYSIQRLCFAADVGTGLTSTIAGDNGKNLEIDKYAVLSVFEVIATGISISFTSLAVISSQIDITNISGTAILISAINATLNSEIANFFLYFIVLLFGLTTATFCCVLSRNGTFTPVDSSKTLIKVFNFAFAICVAISPFLNFELILRIIDELMVSAAVLNIISIYLGIKYINQKKSFFLKFRNFFRKICQFV